MGEIARNAYAIERWSQDYFHVDNDGYLRVQVGDNSARLIDIIDASLQQGLHAPLLIRFPQILTSCAQRLQQAFAKAMKPYPKAGSYFPVYPIKVNQQRRVVKTLSGCGGLGLESGSKSELLAILAQAKECNRWIICNGFKDREYLKLACIAADLGFKIAVILEKESELDSLLSLPEFEHSSLVLGIRIRLMSVLGGHWQNTGGEKSKFGLTATAVTAVIERLKATGHLDKLQLLHAHVGSQIAQLSAFGQGLKEVARWYAQMHQLGCPIDTVDVGGGLGVDYEGQQTTSACSMDYDLDAYSTMVVDTLYQSAIENQLPLPSIITESGRALSAHHAVFITQVAGLETRPTQEQKPVESALAQSFDQLSMDAPLETLLAQADSTLHEAKTLFIDGQLGLESLREIEQSYYQCLERMQKQKAGHESALAPKLATKCLCNFSLFQSLPDIWALNQIFPITPVRGLDKAVSEHVLIKDITCDSDGRIDAYVTEQGTAAALPVPPLRTGDWLSMFMVGAYQEILGDRHNLFGDTDSVHVTLSPNGFEIHEPKMGESKEEVLKAVQFDSKDMVQRFKVLCAKADLKASQKQHHFAQLSASLKAGTYLSTDEQAL